MFLKIKVSWLILLIALLAGPMILLTLSQIEAVAQRSKAADQEPTVDYSKPQANEVKRRAKGRRYDKPKNGAISELPPGVEELPLNSHWWQGISALPIPESTTIVVGTVLDGTAYLSNDRSGIYSEFAVRIEQNLKDINPITVNPGETITAERMGGAVRFPSGKVQRYRISRQGMPQVNERYVFFLKCNGEDYDIITGYQLKDGKVIPLDGGDTSGGENGLQFGKYYGTAEDSFLSELQEAIYSSLRKEQK